MSRILALDTSTSGCSAAVCTPDGVFAEFELAPREHTRKILPMIRTVMDKAGIEMSMLDAIAYGAGPGSFTGLRIAAGTTQGIALGLGIPVIQVSTLEAMALRAATWWTEEHPGFHQISILSLLDARMAEVYWGGYALKYADLTSQSSEEITENLTCISVDRVSPPAQVSLAALQDAQASDVWLSVGEGALAYPEYFSDVSSVVFLPDIKVPRAEEIARIASDRFRRGEFVSPDQSSPVYLRNEITWKKLPGRA